MRIIQISQDLSLNLSQELVCSCCGLNMGREVQSDFNVRYLLFGAVKYAVCPCCRKPVPQPWSQKYKDNYNRFFAKQQAKHQTEKDRDDGSEYEKNRRLREKREFERRKKIPISKWRGRD